MNPISVSAALHKIANLIDNSRSPSKSLVIRDLRSICAGLKKDLFENVPAEYDELGNLIQTHKPDKIVKPKIPFTPRERDFRLAPSTPGVTTDFDKVTLQDLIDGMIVDANIKFKCPWCSKEFDEYPGPINVRKNGSVTGGCDQCNQAMLNNPRTYSRYVEAFRIYLNNKEKPFKYAVQNLTSYKLCEGGWEEFEEYLEGIGRPGIYNSQEREILANITGNTPSQLDAILAKLNLFHTPTKSTNEPELQSIGAFVKYIKDNGKDFCTKELFTKLLNKLRNGLPGSDLKEKRDFLEGILNAQGISIGLNSNSSKYYKSVQTGGPLDGRVKEVLVALKKSGHDTDAETIISLINRKKLGQVPGKSNIIKAYLDEKREKLLNETKINKNEFNLLVAWGIIDNNFNPIYTNLKEALLTINADSDEDLKIIRNNANMPDVNNLLEPLPKPEE